MELQVGVKVLLKNKEGKYLLMRRSDYKGKEFGAGRWDIAGGGVNPGSELMENLAREVLEETGLTMQGEPKIVAAQDIFWKIWPDRHVVRITYVGHADGEIRLSPEHTEFKWFTFEELKKLDNLDPYFQKLIDQDIISQANF